jgi:hypothetical protein
VSRVIEISGKSRKKYRALLARSEYWSEQRSCASDDLQRGEGSVARITCDEQSWPVLIVRFPGCYSDAEFSLYLSGLGAALARQPLALILDTRAAQTPTATQRQLLMRFVKSHWHALNRLCGLAFIVDSSVARHALTAVSWLVAKPCPVELVANMSEAFDWVASRGARPGAKVGGVGARGSLARRASETQ